MKEGCLWERGECLRFSAKLERWLIVCPRAGEGLECRAGASTGGGVGPGIFGVGAIIVWRCDCQGGSRGSKRDCVSLSCMQFLVEKEECMRWCSEERTGDCY